MPFNPYDFGFKGAAPPKPSYQSTAQRFSGAGLTLPSQIPAGTPAASGYMKSRLLSQGQQLSPEALSRAYASHGIQDTSYEALHGYQPGDPRAATVRTGPLTPDFTAALRSTGAGAEDIISRLGGRPYMQPAQVSSVVSGARQLGTATPFADAWSPNRMSDFLSRQDWLSRLKVKRDAS